ncbi:MAG: phasin family protein [Rhodomicrobiaceae bacterium]
MSDPNDTSRRTPLSSSSATVSGTQALGVTIEATQEQPAPPQGQETNETRPPKAGANRKLPGEGDTASIETGEFGVDLAPAVADRPFAAPASDPFVPAPAAALESAVVDHPAAEALSAAVRESVARNEARQDQVVAMFESVSIDFSGVMDDARNDAARITFKLMEFAQANFRSNVELARDYASARSIPDIVGVQTAYFKRQMELMNRQADELRKLTGEIASKKAAQFQLSIARQ